jgi:multidrug efflux pump subunit AcrA (membrane-fusion protein)
MPYRKGIQWLAPVAFLLGVALSVPAEEAKKVGELRYSGVVFPMRSVTMQPNMVTGASARVAEVKFEEGQMVKKNDLLVQLDSREPVIYKKIAEQQVEQDQVTTMGYQRQLEYQIAELKRDVDANEAARKKGEPIVFPQIEVDKLQYNVDLAKIQFDQQKATMQAHVLQVEQAKTRLDDYEIRAPFDGVISVKGVEPGQTVENTTKVCEVLEVAQVLATISVENDYFAAIKEGDPATVTIESLPGRTFSAAVYSKGAVADARSKTFMVKIKIDNKDNTIKPGWYADAVFPAKVAVAKPAK